MKPPLQADIARELITHDVGAGFDVFNDLALYGLRGQVVDLHRADVAAALHHAEHGGLARPVSPGVLALPFVLVALFPADESFVDLDLAAERPIERFGLRGFAKPARHKPRGLLSDPHVAGELRAGDPLFVAGDQPDCNEPLFERQLGILKDRPDLDGEPLPALAALVRFVVPEVVDFRSAAVWAERPISPADRSEMPDTGLLVRESGGQFLKGGEVLQHACLQPTRVI